MTTTVYTIANIISLETKSWREREREDLPGIFGERVLMRVVGKKGEGEFNIKGFFFFFSSWKNVLSFFG